MAVTAVIAAAGSGERLGAGGPKAFAPLAGRPMIEWSLDALWASESVRAIVVAVPPGREGDLSARCEGSLDEGTAQSRRVAEASDAPRPAIEVRIVAGGATRAESVANALAAVETELVAIHDAARPLLTPELLDALVADLVADPGAAAVIPAAPLTDTVKEVAGGSPEARAASFVPGMNDAALVVGRTLDRSRLWAAQTPQVFRMGALRAALEGAGGRGGAPTDEAMLVEAAGGRVLIHPCGPENLKVTTPLDLRVAELLLAEWAGER